MANGKKSGAKFVTITKKSASMKVGDRAISAWNVGKRGFLSIFVGRSKYSGEVTGKNGKVYEKLMASITNKTTGETMTKNCYKNPNGKYYIPSLNIVINPNAPNGGYCGRSGKPKQQSNGYSYNQNAQPSGNNYGPRRSNRNYRRSY